MSKHRRHCFLTRATSATGRTFSGSFRSGWVVLGLSISTVSSLAFTYTDFGSTTGLNLVGTAAQNGIALRLTPVGESHMGSAWHTQQQHVTAGFTTTFSFRLTSPTPPGADGISFNIQNLGINAVADEQGTSSGISISLNTFLYADEPSDNFVGVYRNGFGENTGRLFVFDLNPTPIRMKDGNVHNVAMTYNGSAFDLSIDAIPIFNNLAVSLSPGTDASGNAYVGFGARTGLYWEDQDVLNWTFTAVPEPASLTLLGCAMAGVLYPRWRRSAERGK